MTCLDDVKNALLTVSRNVGHYAAFKATPPYIVWEEDGENVVLHADDKAALTAISGTVDLFTKNLNGEPLIHSIPEALDTAGISHRLNSVQFEEDTGILHYEWTWEVLEEHGDD